MGYLALTYGDLVCFRFGETTYVLGIVGAPCVGNIRCLVATFYRDGVGTLENITFVSYKISELELICHLDNLRFDELRREAMIANPEWGVDDILYYFDKHSNMKKDETNPIGKKWEFDEEVTKVFDDMLSRSIPNYETMRDLCFKMGRHFVNPHGYVSDIGCSNGIAIEPFVKAFPDVRFVLSDVSEPMLEACRAKYATNGKVIIMNSDLRERGVPTTNNDLILSILTLQFTPIEYRQDILESVYESLNEGGAFIMVEKVLGNSSRIDNMLVDEYYNIKRENGYTEELIKNKRKSLEGVLVPLTASFNEHMLATAGFKKVDCFWRCLNFAAWLAIK